MLRMIGMLILVLSASTVYAEVVIDVTKIAGKSEKEVAAYLGQPWSCNQSKYGNKCQYKKGKTEIVFINNKADWITVEGIDQVSFSISAINALGLKVVTPSFSNNFILRWSSIQGLREVSIFKGTSLCGYAYVKWKTK